MSTKDLFKKSNNKILLGSTLDQVGQEVESANFIQEKIVENERYLPDIDFSIPDNFVKFGSAEKYYKDAIERIYKTFPFDGSLLEKQQFYNSSSYLDKYVFDNWYPRSNGYARLCASGWGTKSSESQNHFSEPATLEYIKIKDVMNTGSTISSVGANKYDVSNNRTANLKLNGSTGNTIEFWLKKDAIVSAKTEREVIFDLWNGSEVTHSVGGTYGRFLLYLDGTVDTTYPNINLTYVSGNISACTDQSLGYAFCNDTWNHYAISIKNDGTKLLAKLFINGSLTGSTSVTLGAIEEVTGSMIAYIGAIRTKNTPTESPAAGDGYGKLSASLDDFRFWKVARTDKDIYRNWYTQIGVEGAGGTNLVSSNTDLGVYYKFNEGITTSASYDQIVLDYSGRTSDGVWTGYTSLSRYTGSAMVDKGYTEYKDPIIYSFHPDVYSLYISKINSGSAYDVVNHASFYNSFPDWILDDDQNNKDNTGNLLKLTQIAASYLDTLYLQIQELPKLREAKYLSGSFKKPAPFANRLLEGMGFDTTEIFSDASAINQFLKKDEDRVFEDNIVDVKNNIYNNIYNNLSFIYKSKGTEKAFRNLIRCYGVDDELIKINFYGNNVVYDLKTNYRYTSKRKKYIDFNNVDRFGATVYQYANSYWPNTTAFLSNGSDDIASGSAITFEAEVIFPKKFGVDSSLYFDTPFLTASLFGVHSSTSGLGWLSTDYDFQVYAVRDKIDSKRVYFELTSSYGKQFPRLTSSLFNDVYDNQKWNFAVRLKPTCYPANIRLSGTLWDTYTLDFYGVNAATDHVLNSFSDSATITFNAGSLFMASSKKLYAGAHYTDYTSSLLQSSDVEISSVRVWMDYLSNDAILAHAYDASNFGIERPYENLTLNNSSLNNVFIPKIETLALHWDFSNVTGSDSSGRFYVDDIHSGSNTTTEAATYYKWLGNVTKVQHTARGDFFPMSSRDVVDMEYVYSAKQKLPEILDSSNMIDILERDDTTFTRDTRPIEFFTAIEKSMYQTISEEMINIFATIKDFNNLIGDPVNRYRQNYKDMQHLKSLFFERVQNTPDIEKYVDFYKWIDSSITNMIQQLVPLSANVSEEVRDVVESHILERNKYLTKYPTLEMKYSDPEAGAKSINELTYNWKYGSKPVSNLQKDHTLYWNKRAIRTDGILSMSSMMDTSRNGILIAASSSWERSLTTPHKFGSNESQTIYNGVNFARNKKIDFIKGPLLDNFGLGTNQFILSASTITKEVDSQDKVDLEKKYRLDGKAESCYELSNTNYSYGKASIILPFSIFSSSYNVVDKGYHKNISETFMTGIDFTNLHTDTYGDDKETPMQGPFTERNVGGFQHRHFYYDGSVTGSGRNRQEGWRILFDSTNKTAYIKGPELFYTVETVPKARLYREELAKRPINIKNIRGQNFNNDYEVVQTSGRKYNNKALIISGGFSYPFSGSSYIYGFSDYQKPDRGTQKHVFVERFSAPGGPETAGDSNGGMGLDVDAAEYCVYNSLNYRNSLVRTPLQTLFTRYCGQFGTDSERGGVYPLTYETNASFHKVNRNTTTIMSFLGSTSSYYSDDKNHFATASKYDNWHIQHQIPQDDAGYAWIQSSTFLSGSLDV